ncbi:hypothetical protein EBT23_02610 [bacterium]|nr:hypothetical protein [bacterium]
MRKVLNSTSWAYSFVVWVFCNFSFCLGSSSPSLSLQEDGSLVVQNGSGSSSEIVKQGTPRQSVLIAGNNCNVSYGFNSKGKKVILLSSPSSSTNAVTFTLGGKQITVPPKSALRITLNESNGIEKMDGNPAETVQFQPIPGAGQSGESSDLSHSLSQPPPTQTSPVPLTSPKDLSSQEAFANLASPKTSSSLDASTPPSASLENTGDQDPLFPADWPGKLLVAPIPENQMEEEKFYVRTEFGPRFVSSMNFVSVSGPNSAVTAYNQKEIAFSTGYRQDLDLGVWLTDWFGLAIETGFALNAVRGNTEGMSVSSTTFWTIPLLAQLCFQYPNDSGWYPFINFGFGGGWTVFKVGGINYLPGVPQLSGTGNSVNNAYQIAAGVRYRLYQDLSINLVYKFYGNNQANINLDNGVQATLGSPVTQSAEVGLNFAF